jgi:Holliday junction resolvase RusA-like endonuclease
VAEQAEAMKVGNGRLSAAFRPGATNTTPVEAREPQNEPGHLNAQDKVIRLILPVPPGANHYKKPRRSRSGKFQGFYVAKEAQKFLSAVAWIARNVTPFIDGHVEVSAIIFRGEKNGRLQRGDLLNYEKVLLDSLQGRAYRNDSQIRRATFELREDRKNPRAEVTVTPF